MNEILQAGKIASCTTAKVLGESSYRTFSQGTGDGLNWVSNGRIPDENSNIVHGLMFLTFVALLFPKTRIAGAIGLAIVLGLWGAGQQRNAIRIRPPADRCSA